MSDSRVARRYANALFQAAKKAGIVDSVEADLSVVSQVVRNSPSIHSFFYSPVTSRDNKTAALGKAFADRVTALTMGFIRLMIDKGREAEFELVRMAYSELRRDHEGIVHAVFTSAHELDDAQKAKAIAKLQQVTGRKVEPEFGIDPSLIGGMKVTFDNYELDGTVRGGLSRMKERLVYDVLKQN